MMRNNFQGYKSRGDDLAHKAMIARSISEIGGAKEAAHLIGKSRSMLYLKTDPEAVQEMTGAEQARMVLAGCREIPRYYATLAGGYFVPGDEAKTPLTEAFKRLFRESGEAAACAFEALEDGSLTQPEKNKLAKELDELIAQAVIARAALERQIDV
jgi:hypothetical protein